MAKKIRKIVLLATIIFLGFLTSTTFAAQLNIDEFKEEVEGINEYADYVYIIGKYAFTSAKELTIQDVMLAARSIDGVDGEIETALKKMTIHELEPVLDNDGETTIGWKIVENMVGDTTLSFDKDHSINIEYIDYNKLVNKFHVTFKNGYNEDNPKTIRVEENKNIPTDAIPKFERAGYQFKGWTKDGEEFNPADTQITGDTTLVAQWYKIVDISDLLTKAAEKIKQDDYEAKLNGDSVIFDVKNKAKNNIDMKEVMGDIVAILEDANVKSLKITCTGVEADNSVEFTSGAGDNSATWTQLQELLKKATSKSDFNDVTLGDFIKNGEMRLDVTLDTENAVAKDNKTTFNIKFVEIVDSDKLATSVSELITSGNGYNASYEKGTITINIEDTKIELSSVEGSNMLAALYNLLNDNVNSVELSKDGKTILTAEKEKLSTYTREWLKNILSGEGITKNRDLVDKEFVVTIHLDENAQTGEGAKDITYNLVFKATTYTVTFEDGNGEPEQKVIQGDKATKPAQNPTKDGYEFKFWAKEGETTEFNFENTPVETDLVLEAKYKVIVDISQLLQEAASKITSEDYGVEFNDGTVIFDVKNKSKKNSEISSTGLIGDIVGLLANDNVTSLKVTCKGVEESDNSVVFTKDMVGSGSGPDSLAWATFKELLKKATKQDTFENITLGDLVNSGDMGLEVILDEDKAVAKDNKTQFDIKFVELVQPKELANSVVTLLGEGKGYTAEYKEEDGKRTVTITIDNPQEELKNVEGSNMLVALGNMLNDNVSSLTLAIKNGEEAAKNVLTANREGLTKKEYTHKWLEDKLEAEGITTNKDLLNKEFIVTVNLDENAKVSGTGGKILIYNIVFKAETYTVTFKNGEEQTTKEVLKGEKVTAPETNPTKKGYEFQFWAENGKEPVEKFKFDETPVTEDITLVAVFKVDVDTDALAEKAVGGIVGKGFTAKYADGEVTIDITEIDKQISAIKDTRIMIVLGEILKTEGVKSVTVTYGSENPVVYEATDGLDYDAMKAKLSPVLAKMAGTDDLYGLADKELTVTIEVNEDAILQATDVEPKETVKAEYKVKFTTDYARATSKETLQTALEGNKGHIIIENDFDVSNDIEIKRNVTILTNKENPKTITRQNAEGEDTHVFKITGNANVILESLKLKGATSAAVLVEANATVTANNLTVEDENYNKPAIAVKTGGTVKNANKFTRVDQPCKVIKNEKSDSTVEIKDIKNYYIDELHSKLYKITFKLANGLAYRYCIYNETITIPSGVQKPYDSIERGIRYTFENKWKSDSGAELTGNTLPQATNDIMYIAQYTQTNFTKVTDKDTLVKAISEISDGLPIIIETSEELDVGNLNIDTKESVTLIGKGNVTLKGTITATAKVPSLSLHKLKIVGDGSGNEETGNKYHIIKSEAKKFTMWQSTVSNGAADKQAYSAIYLPVDGVVADIRVNNTFNVDNIYNTIQFGPGKAVGSGTIISNNTFKGKTSTHNHINIYTVADGAKITIERNTFEYSGNAIRLSNTTGASAEFTISNNTYNETDENEYENVAQGCAGFIVMQIAGSADGSDDFSKYTITAIDNKGPNGKVLTADKSDKKYRFEYYASADGKTVQDDNPAGAAKNANITFKNTKS